MSHLGENEEQVLLYNFGAIVAGVGGSLSLFLGFSCLETFSAMAKRLTTVKTEKNLKPNGKMFVEGGPSSSSKTVEWSLRALAAAVFFGMFLALVWSRVRLNCTRHFHSHEFVNMCNSVVYLNTPRTHMRDHKKEFFEYFANLLTDKPKIKS